MKTNAVIYARYSSHNQREQSIEDQVNACMMYAKDKNYNIVGVYTDSALSGKTDNREEFQNMIYDAKQEKFEKVLVWKIDRFGRNVNDIYFYKYQLGKHNVTIESITENIDDSKEGHLLEAVMVGLAQYYSENLAENITRGMRSNAEKCLANGRPLMGYKVVDHKYVIDEEYAPIVKEIFEMYLNGASTAKIAKVLRRRGITNKKGNPIASSSIYKMLQNKRYTGEYRYDDIVVPGGMPAIIDEETFELVNKRMEAQARIPKDKESEKYILLGKLYCGECGKHFTSDTGTGKSGKVYHYYKCFTNKKLNTKHICPSKPIPKDEIENSIIRATMNEVMTDDMISEIARIILDFDDENSMLIKALETKKKDKEKRKKNLLDSIEQGIDPTLIADRLNDLQDEIDDLVREINVQKITHPSLTQEDIENNLREIKKELDNTSSYIDLILDKLIDTIYVYPDGRCVVYYKAYDIPKHSEKCSIKSNLVNLKSIKLNTVYRAEKTAEFIYSFMVNGMQV